MTIGIDKQVLVDENSQAIYAGLAGFLGEHRLKKNMKILIVGNHFALTKYLK